MKLLNELDAYISSQFNAVKALLTLFKLEAKLAGRSIVPLLINLCFLTIISISFWLSLMIFSGYLIFLYLANLWITLALICVFNLVLLVLLISYLSFNLKMMSFKRTRHYFHSQESTDHEKLENTAASSDIPS